MERERLEVSYITAIEAWAREGYTIEVEREAGKTVYAPGRMLWLTEEQIIKGRWFIRKPKEEK